MQMGKVPMFPMPTGPLQSIRAVAAAAVDAISGEPPAAAAAAAPREITLTDRVASRLPSAQWRGRDSPGPSSIVTLLPYCLTTSTQSHLFITVYLCADEM